MSIEDIILSRDRRGISALRPHMSEDFCDQAASLVLASPGTAMIATGFYILSAGAAETDGPPGAVAIGNALQSIGYEVAYVTDRYAAPMMTSVVGARARVIDFPIADGEASRKFARKNSGRGQPIGPYLHREVRADTRGAVPQHARRRHYGVHSQIGPPVLGPPQHSWDR